MSYPKTIYDTKEKQRTNILAYNSENQKENKRVKSKKKRVSKTKSSNNNKIDLDTKINKFQIESVSPLSHLNNSQNFSVLVSTLSLSNTRNKPKTSKEILQEISRLTNGTTPNSKANDLDASASSIHSRNHNVI